MHRTLLLCGMLAFVPAAFAQDGDRTDRPTRKGDTIVVKGCLTGSALQATEVSAPDASALLADGLVFRLSGKKPLLEALRSEHDRKIVEVRGVLKSNLPRPDAGSRSLGGVRIAIGGTSPEAGRVESERRRVLPVLEVKGFDGTGQTPCGR